MLFFNPLTSTQQNSAQQQSKDIMHRFHQILLTVGLLSTALFITSCSNDRPVYQGAEYYKNLEVPPDLTEPDTAEQLRVPDPTEEALQRFRDNNKLETVITPKFDGVRVVSYAGNSWIEVDNSVEHVWPRLLEFWQGEGIGIAEKRPLLGFMDTVWVKRLGDDAGFFSSFLQGTEPDQKDKFRVRLESFDDGAKTRLYVAHSRIEKMLRSEEENEYIWVSKPSDLKTEREIIARMALFAGILQQESGKLLDNYRPYSSLIETSHSNSTAFTMTGSMDFVWRRTVRALDRMQMRDVQEHPQTSTITFTVDKVSNEDLGIANDELSKTSWLMQLYAQSGDKSRAYRIELSKAEGRIQVLVAGADDITDTGEYGDVSGTARVEQLRDVLIKYME